MDFSQRNKKVAIARWKRIHSKLRIEKEFSKEKTAISAYLCGDGSISVREKKRSYEIRFSIDDEKLARRIVRIFKKEFKANLVMKKIISKVPNGQGYFDLRICSRPICKNLFEYGSYGSLTWYIPQNLNKELKKEWIKCFFDCEAYVNLLKKQIQLKSVNYSGINDLKKLLEEINIFPKLYGPYKQKSEKHSPYFFLIIYGKDNIRKYYNEVGFYHPKKMKSLRKLIN